MEYDPFFTGSVEVLRETEPRSGEFRPIFVESHTFEGSRKVDTDDAPAIGFSVETTSRVTIFGDQANPDERIYAPGTVHQEVVAIVRDATKLSPVVITHGSELLPPPNIGIKLSDSRVLIRPTSLPIGVEIEYDLIARQRNFNPHAPIPIGVDDYNRQLRINVVMVDLPEGPLKPDSGGSPIRN